MSMQNDENGIIDEGSIEPLQGNEGDIVAEAGTVADVVADAGSEEAQDVNEGFAAEPSVEAPIKVRTITVRTGRMVCDIAIASKRYRYSTPKLAAFVTRQYPNLPLHACVNGSGNAFGSVIESTSVPHMLEHLVIDIQTKGSKSAVSTFVGTTEWMDEESGEARVEFSFRDDLEALRAFNEATQFLNTAVLTCLS